MLEKMKLILVAILIQYIAIDEYSRFRYVEAFKEHNSYSATIFLEHVIKAFKFPIKCVQTDNGAKFTKRLCQGKQTPTMFEIALKKHNIQHKLILPYTPRHNGKVERSHRKDNEQKLLLVLFANGDATVFPSIIAAEKIQAAGIVYLHRLQSGFF